MSALPDRLSHDDRNHLERALELAREAAAFASPNPTVGCVLASAIGVVLGEGAHLYDRRDHAEVAALKAAAAAGHAVQGATAYVTLEPCTVSGRTGPCADALIAAGISRCFIATADPNPAVHGNGIARMSAAGVTVTLLDPSDPVAQQARRLNDAFAFSIVHGRPFITLKSALSVDGKLAPAASQRSAAEPFWLTGNAARADVQTLRHSSDAILTGIGTVLADDPSLTDRTALPRRRPLLRIVLDSSLRIPVHSKMVATVNDDLLVLCNNSASVENEARLRERGVQIQRSADFREAFNFLAGQPIRSLLIEAGTMVNSAFLHLLLVDKAVLYFADREIGADGVPFATNALPQTLLERMTSQTRAAFPNGNSEDIRITGYLHDPWSSI